MARKTKKWYGVWFVTYVYSILLLHIPFALAGWMPYYWDNWDGDWGWHGKESVADFIVIFTSLMFSNYVAWRFTREKR